jgi:LPXTG-site transpeptidase (sortase) family protein
MQDSSPAPPRVSSPEPRVEGRQGYAQKSGPVAPRLVRKEMPRPVRIVIPAIRVSARVIPLGLNPDRTLEVPSALADTGWYTGGPEPGERGAAVIAGHVASRNGPGVFLHLRDLRAGAMIKIHLEDGTVVRYVARSSITVPKNRFPTRLVYAQTPRPTLRLITCSGTLDPATGQHRDNYIVFASVIERGASKL